MITVLLTDGEFTGMIRALREIDGIRIIGFGSSSDVAHQVMLDGYYVAPAWNSSEYISFLIDIISKEHVDYVFPVVTASLELMAGAADEIREKTGAVVITSSPEAIAGANDKGRLFKLLSGNALTSELVTEFAIVETVGEAWDNLRFQVMKPCIGENREGFIKIVTDEEWQSALLAGETSGITCPSALRMIDGSKRFDVPRLMMPYLPGQEWDCDILVRNGRIISVTTRKNSAMFGGLSSCTETAFDQRVFDACQRIVDVTGLEYLNCISFKEDENGDLKLLEINPRAMGSIHVSSLGGNNLVKRLFEVLRGNDTEDLRITPSGIRTSLYYDILTLPTKGGSEK